MGFDTNNSICMIIHSKKITWDYGMGILFFSKCMCSYSQTFCIRRIKKKHLIVTFQVNLDTFFILDAKKKEILNVPHIFRVHVQK